MITVTSYGHHRVSNERLIDCMFNSFSQQTPKQTSKGRCTCPSGGESNGDHFQSRRASNAESVSMTPSWFYEKHDHVIKWKHFPRNWPFVRGIHRSPVNSPHKGQWRGALMFSLICVWINDQVNNREAGDLRRYRGHYDVIVMIISSWSDVISREIFW